MPLLPENWTKASQNLPRQGFFDSLKAEKPLGFSAFSYSSGDQGSLGPAFTIICVTPWSSR